ncbi:hypothetical protein VNO78_12373 [Psophocarpus tetragonolobus]|uniref:C2H2-type domain-containing protein n=1 Tax=Psophocarpus tetragonolobus TaxID=3891 RepID=A0AAN9SQV2_PSOTE
MQEKQDEKISLQHEVSSMDVDEVISTGNPFPTVRECDICGKKFESGKSLGGHRRSHFLKKKKVKVGSTSKAGDSSNRANSDDDHDDENDNNKFICVICQKKFSIRNSLSAHMRVHRVRSVKSVSRVTRSSSSLISNYVDDDTFHGDSTVIASEEHHIDAIDLETYTSPSWVKKDVRGRGYLGVYKAAETLTYLSSWSN